MPSNPFTDPQWASKTVGSIDRLVALIRRYTTRPLVVIARGLIFGILAIAAGLLMFTLFIIGGSRALVALGDVWFAHGTAVWLSYIVLGSIFTLIGAVLMRRRRPQNN
ncbi:MAG: hypothetical protein ABI570_08360 [Ilumatobacteraceae bacterium]